MVALSREVEDFLQQVQSWPAENRLALVRRVLETLEVKSTTASGVLKGPSSQQVLGLWNSGGTAPTDEECDQILAEELLRKHAS